MRIISLVLALLLPFAALADENSIKANTLTVHGEAVTRAAPDLLMLPVSVHEENESLKVAKERHDDKLRKLLKLAEGIGIPKEKMETSFTAVNPVYDYDKDSSRPRLRGYRVETGLNFKLTDFSKLGDFMDGIIEAGIDDIGSVSYTLQDEDKVKDDTLNLAMQHAYEKATRLAQTAKVTLDKPLIIEEGDFDIQRPMPPRPRPMMRAGMAMAAMAPEPPELPSGLVEVHQSVTVTYSLK